MSGDAGPTLTPNSMTIIELEGFTLDELTQGLSGRLVHKLSVMLEVEPDGSTAVKLKLDNTSWSPPFITDVSARVERLYP